MGLGFDFGCCLGHFSADEGFSFVLSARIRCFRKAEKNEHSRTCFFAYRTKLIQKKRAFKKPWPAPLPAVRQDVLDPPSATVSAADAAAAMSEAPALVGDAPEATSLVNSLAKAFHCKERAS